VSNFVWVEINRKSQLPTRIFKNQRAAFSALGLTGFLAEWDRTQAVASIRHQCFRRAERYCELCASLVLESNGHMHEQQHRGKGGEISLANSVFICAQCHRRAHSDREPKFTRRTR